MNDVIRMVNDNHEHQKELRANNKLANYTKSRVSNDKGEVIGIVTFFEGIKKKAMNYILADRKRAIAFITALTIGTVMAESAIVENINTHLKEKEELLNSAHQLSVSEALEALDTESYNDDAAVVDYYMQSVVKDPASIKPTDTNVIYNEELRNRLEHLSQKIQSLQNSETLGVDRDALIQEYKEEYTAIVKAMQEQNIYYNFENNLEEAKNSR